MSDTEPTLSLPLDPLLGMYHSEGAASVPHSNHLLLANGPELGDTVTIRQPKAADLSDPKLAVGALGVRQVFERRRGVVKIDGDGRTSDSYKVEKRGEFEPGVWKELVRADHDLRIHEATHQHAVGAFYSVGEATDARDATLDGERRAFLRGLNPDERTEALRDPLLLQAAMRAPTLAGIRHAPEVEAMQRTWQRHVDARDPARATAFAEAGERLAWSRNAIDSATRVLAKETVTAAQDVATKLDAADQERLGALVEIVGRRFSLRRAA
jgi:hypothetical protein